MSRLASYTRNPADKWNRLTPVQSSAVLDESLALQLETTDEDTPEQILEMIRQSYINSDLSLEEVDRAESNLLSHIPTWTDGGSWVVSEMKRRGWIVNHYQAKLIIIKLYGE